MPAPLMGTVWWTHPPFPLAPAECINQEEKEIDILGFRCPLLYRSRGSKPLPIQIKEYPTCPIQSSAPCAMVPTASRLSKPSATGRSHSDANSPRTIPRSAPFAPTSKPNADRIRREGKPLASPLVAMPVRTHPRNRFFAQGSWLMPGLGSSPRRFGVRRPQGVLGFRCPRH